MPYVLFCIGLPLTLSFDLFLPLSLDLFLPLFLPLPSASTSMGSVVGSPSMVVHRFCAWTIFTTSSRTDL